MINNSDKVALLMELTWQRETVKKHNAIPNKVSIDCAKCCKGKRVDTLTDAYAGSQEAGFAWAGQGWPAQGGGM